MIPSKEEMKKLAKEDPDKLIKEMRRMRWPDLSNAAEILGNQCQLSKARDYLIELTRHMNASVRERAVYGLSVWDDEETIEALKRLDKDPSPAVREAAEDALELMD